MALTKCKECSSEVSTDAKTCPKCGARLTMKLWKKICLWLAGLWMIGTIAAIATPKPAEKSPEEKAAIEAENTAKVFRFAAAREASGNIKAGVRDPDSLVISTLNTNESATAVCIGYRAKNGFGGFSKSYVAYVNGKPYQDNAQVWNKNCTKGMYDMKHAVESGIKTED